MLLPVCSDEAGESKWMLLKKLVLDALPAASSKRIYEAALDGFWAWYFQEPRPAFSKAVVQQYRTHLEALGYAPSTVALHLSAVRRLAVEAADNGLLDPHIAAAIARAKGPKRLGTRLGNWLSSVEAAALICAPEASRLKGLRDRAILAVSIGCGLRRGEVAALRVEHLQIRDGRWVIVDLIGKGKRIRTVPVPAWVKEFIDIWLSRAGIQEGYVFRRVSKGGTFIGDRMTSQAIYELTLMYSSRRGRPIAPHDLRRTFAKLAHAGAAPVEQIQYTLGHASLLTTERYLGLKQNLVDAPGDRILLPLPGV